MQNEVKTYQADLKEFIIFSLVGASGFVVELTFFNLFSWLGIPLLVAAGLAMPIAASSNWFLNRRFTFRMANKKKAGLQWTQYLLISAIGWAINLALFWAGYSLLKLDHNIAKAGATLLVWFWNYFANKLWTFKVKD